ncbi:MAG: hypothetical protein U0103_13595 [Candidatus Obscuribacterales bacterium]|nr:MAG: hypothetical protein EKK48_07955 [Candidatus Melainabacteria bacterium]
MAKKQSSGRDSKTNQHGAQAEAKAPLSDMIYCYYDGLSYSPGAFLKIDGFQRKLLYCNSLGTWDVKDEPS